MHLSDVRSLSIVDSPRDLVEFRSSPPSSEASSSPLDSSNRSFLEASPRRFFIAFADSPYLSVHYDKTVSMFAIAKSALRSDFRVFQDFLEGGASVSAGRSLNFTTPTSHPAAPQIL